MKIYHFLIISISFALLATMSCNTQKTEDQATPPPNILFAIADDASFPHMSAYGCEWVKTPAIKGFQRVKPQ